MVRTAGAVVCLIVERPADKQCQFVQAALPRPEENAG